VDPRYQIEFVGYEKDDPVQRGQIRESQLRTSKTIDDLRLEDGDKPFNEPWSTIPLNPLVVQLLQGAQFAQPMLEEDEMDKSIKNDIIRITV
jgi:hypothetical protein